MKRSTIFFIILLVILVVSPIVYIVLVAKDVVELRDWVVEEFQSNDDNEELSYKMRITSLNDTFVPDCYMNITTYDGMVVDTLQSVNFVVPADGVTAVLRNDSIIVVLDNVNATVFDGLCLTVELPKNSRLEITNNVPTVDIRMHDAELSTLEVASLSSLDIKDSNIGAFVSVDKTSDKILNIADTNVGAMKINGDNMTFAMKDSNVGALTIAGVCDAIKMNDSKVGVCSWNNACNQLADISDCVITSRVEEDVLDISIDNDENVSLRVKSDSASTAEGNEKVDISPSGVKVNDGDGTNVDISLSGVHVDSDEATVHITPTGIVVKEGDEEVVKIGIGGVKVKN